MAPRKCPECGAEAERGKRECPECGASLRRPRKKKGSCFKKLLFLLILVIILGGGGLAAAGYYVRDMIPSEAVRNFLDNVGFPEKPKETESTDESGDKSGEESGSEETAPAGEETGDSGAGAAVDAPEPTASGTTAEAEATVSSPRDAIPGTVKYGDAAENDLLSGGPEAIDVAASDEIK